MIAVVEYEGNLRSVQKGLEAVGADVAITSDPDVLRGSQAIVLPGQGSFGTTMERLDESGVSDAIRDAVSAGKPYLGLCVGLQVLFESSEEAPGVRGLGLLRGKVVRFKPGMKVPHMGWNQLEFHQRPPIFRDVPEGAYVYFVHSYHVVPDDPAVIATTTDYGTRFVSSVHAGNVCATQFHPEKSQDVGLAILRAFVCTLH